MKKISLWSLVPVIAMLALVTACPNTTSDPIDDPDPVENESLTISNAVTFDFALPAELQTGAVVSVHVTGNNTGTTGFRSWLIDGSQTTLSNLYTGAASSALPAGAFDLQFDLTATGAVTKLLFKGPSYGVNIDSLEIESLSVTIDETETVIDLSTANIALGS